MYCSVCGKEVLDEAVICPGCGCAVQKQKTAQQDYKTILRKTKLFLVIGLVLLALGLFAWIATPSLAMLYTKIGEHTQANILGQRITMELYYTCDSLAYWSSVIFFFAAEIMFIIPREKFNAAFKRENHMLLISNKAEYKKAAKEKNKELNKEIPCYRISRVLAVVSCALFVFSVIMPSLSM